MREEPYKILYPILFAQRYLFSVLMRILGLNRRTYVREHELGEWISPSREPKRQVVFYIHGGGFCFGGGKSNRALGEKLAFYTQREVYTFDYALSPEYPFPIALNDCLSAYQHLQHLVKADQRFDSIVFVGDSAGGNLALSLLMLLSERKFDLPIAVVCLSPWLDLSKNEHSSKHRDPILTSTILKIGRTFYTANRNDLKNPLISPFFGSFPKQVPILIHAGTHEILLEEILEFENRMKKEGCNIEIKVWPNQSHVFQIKERFIKAARDSLQDIRTFIDRVS